MVSLSDGEYAEVIPVVDVIGQDEFILEVGSNPVRIATERQRANNGRELPANSRRTVIPPEGQAIFAYAHNGATSVDVVGGQDSIIEKGDVDTAEALREVTETVAADRLRTSLSDLGSLAPAAKDEVFNTAVNAETDILSSNASPNNDPSRFRVLVALDTAAVLEATLTRGGTTVTTELNDGNSLDKNSLYEFSFPVQSGDGWNFQVKTAATVLRLTVDEVIAAA